MSVPHEGSGRESSGNEDLVENALFSLGKLSGLTQDLIVTLGEKGVPANSYDGAYLSAMKHRLDANPGEVDTVLREYGQWIASLSKKNPKLVGLIEQYQNLPREIKMLWQHLSNPGLVRTEIHHIFLEFEKNLGKEQAKPFTDRLMQLEKIIRESEELSFCIQDMRRWNLLKQGSQEIIKRIEMYRKMPSGNLHETLTNGLDSYQDQKLLAILKQSPSLRYLSEWADAYAKLEVQKARLNAFKENILKKDFREGKWESSKGSEAFAHNIDKNAKIIEERFGNLFLANALRSSKGIEGRSELMVQFLQTQIAIIEGDQVRMKEVENRMLLSVQNELMWVFGRRISSLREEEEKILSDLQQAYYGSIIKFPKEGLLALMESTLAELWDKRRILLKKRMDLRKELNKAFMKRIIHMAKEMKIEEVMKNHLSAVASEGRAIRNVALAIPQARIKKGIRTQLQLIQGASGIMDADYAVGIKIASKERIIQNALMLRRRLLEGEQGKYILDAAKECTAIYRWLGSVLILTENQKSAREKSESMMGQLRALNREGAPIIKAEPERRAA